jgi:hypothetical protein
MEFNNIYRRQKSGMHSAEFASQCQNHFSNASVTYEDFLKNLKLHTLYDRRRLLDALFSSSVYSGLKCCSSLLHSTVIRVPLCNFRNHSLLSLVVKTFRLQDAFWPLTLCLKMLITFGIPLHN